MFTALSASKQMLHTKNFRFALTGGSVCWSVVPHTKRWWVPSPVGAPAWAAGSVSGWGVHGRPLVNVSLSH